MIISLDDAKAIDPNITQADLNGFETAVRALTNNKFQNHSVVSKGVTVSLNNKLTVTSTFGLRVGDTVELVDSKVNDGLYVIAALTDTTVTLQDTDLFNGEFKKASMIKVEYPDDIKVGIKKLIQYDVKMADKVGIKSETISRMSTTYYDATAAENVNGYPSAYMSFLDKYRKIRWS
ncbi:hypothetical protein [Weissella cibaria]|uniref:hypothetical protein n=1 Tax=Bacilli TaxID=91061 RepID=UPI00215A5C87|nr:hypothetical protein [Weissella cibaria]MCR8704179.1 hypothetical protein [Weissella cibaria]